MLRVGGEPVSVCEPVAQVVEIGVGKLHRCTAAPAHSVVVGVTGEVVGDRLVTETSSAEDARLPQRVDGPVDGRQVDRRGATTHPGCELLHTDVVVARVEELGEHGASRRGHPDPAVPQLVEEGIETAG